MRGFTKRPQRRGLPGQGINHRDGFWSNSREIRSPYLCLPIAWFIFEFSSQDKARESGLSCVDNLIPRRSPAPFSAPPSSLEYLPAPDVLRSAMAADVPRQWPPRYPAPATSTATHGSDKIRLSPLGANRGSNPRAETHARVCDSLSRGVRSHTDKCRHPRAGASHLP